MEGERDMDRAQIQLELRQRADEKYRNFASGLLPGTQAILGVRLPDLRALAKKIAHEGDWRESLRELSDDTFEEIMLQGFVIGYARCSIEEKLELVRGFVPKIDNWSVCDSFCTSLKFVKSEKERVFSFLQPYLASDREFEQRFGCVMLLDYYIDDDWLPRTVAALLQVPARAYYAKMAAAWALAECYLHDPERLLPILSGNTLDPEVQQKALQKITESRTISPEERARIRALKSRLKTAKKQDT